MDVNGFGIRVVLGLVPRFGVFTEGNWHLERRQQLLVHAAPLLIRLTLFSFSTFFWIMSRHTGTYLASIGLMIVIVSVVQTLLSANSYVNSSGYVLLTTFLDMPNLRRKAYSALLGKYLGRQNTSLSDENLFALRAYTLVSVTFWIFMFGILALLVHSGWRAIIRGRV